MRLILALAVLVASLGVATSGRLPSTRDERIADPGSRREQELTAAPQGPLRWSGGALKKRTAPPPYGGRLAVPSASSVVTRPSGWVAADSPAPAGLGRRAASHPASPRAPPRLPS